MAGGELPQEWARELFPPERNECELTYAGKATAEQILADTMAVPLQEVSTFGGNGSAWHNKLVFGDNLQVMKHMLDLKQRGTLANADGSPGARLIYIDPPFATRQEFRGSRDQKAYQDKIAGAAFLEFFRKRLVLLRELLADDGSIYVHLDQKKGHYVKVLLDEIFGEEHFQREIIWDISVLAGFKTQALNWIRGHDIIYYYSKGGRRVFNKLKVPHRKEYLQRFTKKDKAGELYFDGRGERVYLKAAIKKGKTIGDVWGDIMSFQQIPTSKERIDYPTQKPEALLDRIVRASSAPGDLVLDAFAGSGTTCAVAEKLGRRWIGIDCGKLAIYTVQKRMLNLRTEIGNTGKPLQASAFTLYNAGLYDFETLRSLSWEGWRAIALELFECKDEPHTIRGFKLDGKRKGSSVLVFDYLKNKGGITRETIGDIHASIGQQVGSRCFIIAPKGFFHFQEDYVEIDGVRYYALRIPYSIIRELHARDFSAIRQPADEKSVNETVDAVGFDFIQAPAVEYKAGRLPRATDRGDTYLQIRKFASRARIKGGNHRAGMEAFSMLMLDYAFDGKVFDLDEVFYADALQANGWKAVFPLGNVKGDVLAVFLDIYGNEARLRVSRSEFDLPSRLGSVRKGTAKK